ncbi:tyrosine-type recombinase/integrase [Paracoccus yeei]|uniref:tyrosine-type recombinase/integrase n=1 Tax=Paracoccus yeei TaxID=147645 RepID=UPI00143037E3|nr:site-specific integrase [Paracoccus yeei]
MARTKAAAIISSKSLDKIIREKIAERGDKKGNLTVAVGGDGCEGLLLQIAPDGRTSWILRAVFPNGKRREMGLGKYPDPVGLSDAREAARSARKLIHHGIDPIDERTAKRDAKRETNATSTAKGMTFAEAVDGFVRTGQLEALKNAKHKAQWESTLMTYAVGVARENRKAPRGRLAPEGIGKNGIGDKLVADLTKHDIAAILEPIWTTIPETAKRLRGRIEAVIRWADGQENRDRDNPARWVDLKHNGRLFRRGDKKTASISHPALAEKDAPAWFADLRTRPSISARALEFLALTAVRSIELRGAQWSEFEGLDGDEPIWTIPANRMKKGKMHKVPLSQQAVELLRVLPRHQGKNLVFVAPRGGMLSADALEKLMKERHAAQVAQGRAGWQDENTAKIATPHGLRATFRTWAQGGDREMRWPWHVAEAVLAHKISGSTQLSYARSTYLNERRGLMQEWADYLTGRAGAQALPEAAE